MAGTKKRAPAGQTSTPPTPGEPGRPSSYTPEVAADLCAYLAQGESLRKACAREGMPSVAAVFRWLSKSNEEEWAAAFREQYARAKEEAADAMAEEILDISDEDLLNGDDGKLVNAAIQRNRLRVDTRKWLMAKMKPKRYGDKLDLTSDNEKISPGMGIDAINAILARAEQEAADRANKAAATSQKV